MILRVYILIVSYYDVMIFWYYILRFVWYYIVMMVLEILSWSYDSMINEMILWYYNVMMPRYIDIIILRYYDAMMLAGVMPYSVDIISCFWDLGLGFGVWDFACEFLLQQQLKNFSFYAADSGSTFDKLNSQILSSGWIRFRHAQRTAGRDRRSWSESNSVLRWGKKSLDPKKSRYVVLTHPYIPRESL